MLSYGLVCTQMPPDALRLSQILANPFRSSEMSCHGMLFAFVGACARSLRNVGPSRSLRAVRACKHFACKSTQIRSDASTCSHMPSDAPRCHQMPSYDTRCSRMISDALICFHMPPNASRCTQMLSCALKWVQIVSYALKCSHVLSNALRCSHMLSCAPR